MNFISNEISIIKLLKDLIIFEHKTEMYRWLKC